MTLFLIVCAILFTTVAQILLKLATIRKNNFFLVSGYFSLILVIGASFLLMKLIELKYFTVIMTLNYLTVFLLSAWIFKEEINKSKLIGILFIIIGVCIFSFGGDF